MSYNNKSDKSLNDIWENDNDMEMYNDAQHLAAQKQAMEDMGIEEEEHNEEKYKRRAMRFREELRSDEIEDDDPKWDKYKI